MRDTTKTIGGIIDKSGVSIISSVDNDGFPNTKAMLPTQKKDRDKRNLFYDEYFVHESKAIHGKPESMCLFLR